jgi:cell division protein FtsL
MSDKTPLEKDLEQRELVRTPWTVKVFILLVVAGLCIIGLYSYDLQKKLLTKEKEITELRELYQEERNELLDEIKSLEGRITPQKPRK